MVVAQRTRPASRPRCRSTACSSPSATRRTRRSSAASSSSIENGYIVTHDGAKTSVAGRLRVRRRSGSHLPAGDHRGRLGLHGGDRRRALPRQDPGASRARSLRVARSSRVADARSSALTSLRSLNDGPHANVAGFNQSIPRRPRHPVVEDHRLAGRDRRVCDVVEDDLGASVAERSHRRPAPPGGDAGSARSTRERARAGSSAIQFTPRRSGSFARATPSDRRRPAASAGLQRQDVHGRAGGRREAQDPCAGQP